MAKKIFIKFGMLSMLVASTLSLIFSFPFFIPSDTEGYLAEYSNKKNLLEKTSGDRIIIVGGSNVAFGIDSNLIHATTNYQTINMGLQAGLGLRFMLSDVLPYIQKGDIIILSPEYEQFGETYNGGIQNTLLYATDPTSAKNITSTHQIPGLISHTLMLLQIESAEIQRRIKREPEKCKEKTGVYCKSSFNDFGDIVSHHTKEPINIKQRTVTMYNKNPSTESLRGIAMFAHKATKKGALVVFSFPPLATRYFDANSATIEQYEAAIKTIPFLVVLDKPSDHRYDESLFFDTEYHLSMEGKEERTRRLLSKLTSVKLFTSI